MRRRMAVSIYQHILHELAHTKPLLTTLYKHDAICTICVLLLLTYGESFSIIKYKGFKSRNIKQYKTEIWFKNTITIIYHQKLNNSGFKLVTAEHQGKLLPIKPENICQDFLGMKETFWYFKPGLSFDSRTIDFIWSEHNPP